MVAIHKLEVYFRHIERVDGYNKSKLSSVGNWDHSRCSAFWRLPGVQPRGKKEHVHCLLRNKDASCPNRRIGRALILRVPLKCPYVWWVQMKGWVGTAGFYADLLRLVWDTSCWGWLQSKKLDWEKRKSQRPGLAFKFFFLFLHVRIAELTLGMVCSFLVCCFLFFSSVADTASSTLSAKWLYVYPRSNSYKVISPLSNFRQQKFPSTHTNYISVGYEYYFWNSHWHD